MGAADIFRLPPEPITSRPIEIDAGTSCKRLVVRSMFSVSRVVIPATMLMVVQQASQMAIPLAMGTAIDRGISRDSPRDLVQWVAILAVAYFVFAVAYRWVYRLEILAMALVRYRLRLRLAASVIDARRVTTLRPGEALSVFTTDVDRLGQAPGLLVYPFGSAVAVSIVTGLLFTIDWSVGLAALVGSVLLVVLFGKLAAPVKSRITTQLGAAGDATAVAADYVAGVRVIKGIRAEDVAARRFNTASQDMLGATLRLKQSEAFYRFQTDLLSGLFVSALAVALAWMALAGRISLGELISGVGLAQFMIGPVQFLTKELGSQWASANAAARRFLDVFNAPIRTAGVVGVRAVDAVPPLAIIDATVGALSNIDLTVQDGELVGLVTEGRWAAVLEDIFALRRPLDSGALFVAGNMVGDTDDSVLRQHLLSAPHQADLFDGSLLENIAAGRDLDPTAIDVALRASMCEEFIAQFPRGLNEPIGERGARLSGGQRQRVALARALAGAPPVLVLNEPTTSVDSVTEASIAQELRSVRGAGATVLITTSPALLAVTDRVHWLRAGNDHVVGQHADLLAHPEYRELCE